MKYGILFLLLMVVCVVGCSALPTTDAVTSVTSRGATFNSHGGATSCWFLWGASNTRMIYQTTNYTPCSGTSIVSGSPILTSTTYYVRACDVTGCGNTVSFTTPTSTISNLTHYGDGVLIMFQSGMNVTQVMGVVISPYTNTMSAPVTWGMLFMFIFLGLWIKPKDITIPLILAFIAGGAIWSGTSALGIPPEFTDIGQGLMYAAVAGLVFSWFTR